MDFTAIVDHRPGLGLLLLVVALVGGYFIWNIVYNLYLHPLSSYPGPKLWAISNAPSVLAVLSGHSNKKITELHNKYGQVVRLGPNWMNYTHSDAFNQIAGHCKPGAGVNEKDDRTFGFLRDTIIGATCEDHTRYRKKLAAGFSQQAMRSQQMVIMKYVDLLLQQMRERGENGKKPLDMTAWYNWLTFDIIGHLTFGDSFHGLENAAYHPWISLLFESLKMVGISAELRRWPWLDKVLARAIPAEVWRKAKEHHNMTAEMVQARLAIHSDYADFMDAMTSDKNPKDAMTISEINANASVLVTAGSETTASGLAAMTYYICTNRDVLAKMEHEVRSTFGSEVEMTLESVSQLEYTMAVINETLRLFPPAPATAIRTINPGGDTILGKYLPPGIDVGVSYWANHHDPANWALVESFIPERWLGDPRFVNDAKASFIAFSAGPRTCLGMNLAYAEMRLTIAKLIWHFDLRLSDECEGWVDRTKHYLNWVKEPLMIYFVPRDTK
ncbi:cytochrome P450 [Cadophora sp. MPI-SDFR-AT-0126]|nr:cytochrome P450 [Leotiomycetes sp. MPI-SDFR-AT-0126]